ncbi:MAG: hypothetical protein KVP17_001398 [Porospora cf. gigantea B]|uniref:uncharacterized protein n=1 Tax=Porospora cf. gigantea B TaxID=2853592 RepID=UPI003571D386|nr:MAG: hypothetical protein KVP17_001398 [Porospora cf. gigantea B]
MAARSTSHGSQVETKECLDAAGDYSSDDGGVDSSVDGSGQGGLDGRGQGGLNGRGQGGLNGSGRLDGSGGLDGGGQGGLDGSGQGPSQAEAEIPGPPSPLEKSFRKAADSSGRCPVDHIPKLCWSIDRAPNQMDLDRLSVESAGMVTFQQFQQWLTTISYNDETPERLEEAFFYIDPKKTGLVSKAQLYHLMTVLGDKLDHRDVTRLLQMTNQQDDDPVDYRKLLRWLLAVH